MKEPLLTLCWLSLAAIHVLPAFTLFAPALLERMYGVSPTSTTGLLLVHRGALFLVVLAIAGFAAFSPTARPAAKIVVSISVLSFLAPYARAGFPSGALRPIAIADAVALIPLALVASAAWR